MIYAKLINSKKKITIIIGNTRRYCIINYVVTGIMSDVWVKLVPEIVYFRRCNVQCSTKIKVCRTNFLNL